MLYQGASSLLEKAKDIISKQDIIDKTNGGKFNIFTILERDRSEVRHSRMIAELLSSKGSHGQGSSYLKYFYDLFEQEFRGRWIGNEPLDAEEFFKKALVSTEQSHTQNNQRGFIDIVIETPTHAIIIENKIDAGDQDAQLVRYAKSKNKNVLLIYLTIDGKDASETSKGSLKSENIVLLSYSSHIIQWIEKCIEASMIFPPIREILIQYEKLLRKITNQNEENMDKEIVALLLQEEHIKIANNIQKAFPMARAHIELKFWKKLNELLLPKILEKKFQNWEYTDQEVIELILQRPKQGSTIIEFFYPEKYQEDRYFNFGIGADGYDEKLYIVFYLCNKNGDFIKESGKECVEKLDNPFLTNNSYFYFGESRSFYYDGVMELIDTHTCDQLAKDSMDSLIPIIDTLIYSIEKYFNNKKNNSS